LRQGRIINLHGGGNAVKSYIHIRDVSQGELNVLEGGRIGETYHISPDSGISVRNLVSLICETLGYSFEDCSQAVDERPGQDAAYVIDSTKIRAQLNWKPRVGLQTGLSECVDWIDEHWKEILGQPLEYEHKA
jgi:dTDP-glucose 4,6-dehydratase